MKKYVCIIIAVLLAFAFSACGGEEHTSSAPEVSAAEQQSVPAKPEPQFCVNGRGIEEYRIIYRKTNVPSQYKFVAEALRDTITQKYGFTPEVYPEDETLPAQEAELLVGMCEGRDFCEDFYYEIYNDRGDHFIAVKGATVLFAANNAGGAYLAAKEFVDMAEKGEITDMKQKGTGKITTVACIGGSITEGSNSEDPNKNYPTYLQEMLGPEYFVMNFGVSGYSIVNTDQYAYCKTSQYKKSLEANPDIVIFALGCNDCNPTSNQPYKAWEGTDRAEKFVKSTKELLDSYKALPSAPKIYMCLPCSLFKVPGDQWNAAEWAARIENYALPLLRQIAQEYELPVIDLWSWSKEHPEVFTDGLHPKNESYRDYALAVYNGMSE